MTPPTFSVHLSRDEAAACRYAVIPGACPMDLRGALASAKDKLQAVETAAIEPQPEEESMTSKGFVLPTSSASGANTTVRWSFKSGGEKPVLDMERKVRKALLKTKQQSAGEIARRAGLAGSDGSGRRIGVTLAELVRRGDATVHGTGSRRRYTRA